MRMSLIAAAAALVLLPWDGRAQEDVFLLDGIVVTTSPTPRSIEAVSSHVTVLSGQELRAEGISSVSDALRREASLDIVRSGSFGGQTSLFLRGGESDHTLVLVDGVQVNEPGGFFDFSSLTTDNVERIEVVRGPSSALYGSDAVAGVIHIVTRVGRGPPRVRTSLETAYYSEPRNELLDGVRWSADVAGGWRSLRVLRLVGSGARRRHPRVQQPVHQHGRFGPRAVRARRSNTRLPLSARHGSGVPFPDRQRRGRDRP